MGKSAFRKRIAEADFLEPVPGRNAPGQQPAGADLPAQVGRGDDLLRSHDLMGPAQPRRCDSAR
jgi:hypothetical protein